MLYLFLLDLDDWLWVAGSSFSCPFVAVAPEENIVGLVQVFI
jgi:hypothetical protein